MDRRLPTPVEPLEAPIPLPDALVAPERRWQKVAGFAGALVALGLLPEQKDAIVTLFGIFAGANLGEHVAKRFKK